MEKVMLSKEEALALESALEGVNGDKESVSQYHATSGLWEGKCQALNDLGLKEINIALYVGYEIEKGPEEMVYDYYLKNIERGPVIENVLNLLNIQIKGINC
ncbi:hypothetical protein [Bacillus sp. FJAT-29814]|uniref:hypothetical protein n=1 Tax=Bacillus sp. FJAT-29814 TaxID=1729688 RepID=UPI00083588DF|nr:hypothetical protein [Bacillus sp. FJAT-29814]